MDIIAAPGIQRVSDWFRWRLVTRAAELGLSADCIAMVISMESGFRANVKNALGYKYAGLIGFGGANYKKALRMSAEEQLDQLVFPHFQKAGLGSSKDCGDYYMATFMPVFTHSRDDIVIGEKGNNERPCAGCPTKHSLYVANNTPGCPDIKGACYFDGDKDGKYTVGDVKNLIRQRASAAASKPRIPIPEKEPPKPSSGLSRGTGILGTAIVLGVAAFIFKKVVK